jgi:hypothetical protein
LLAAPCVVVADAGWIEPQWVKIRRLRPGGRQAGPSLRSFHRFASQRRPRPHPIRRGPDQFAVAGFCLFHRRHHGRGKFLPEALEILSGIKSPMYGVPGNHDYWSRAPFNDISKCFAATGGAWLVDQHA